MCTANINQNSYHATSAFIAPWLLMLASLSPFLSKLLTRMISFMSLFGIMNKKTWLVPRYRHSLRYCFPIIFFIEAHNFIKLENFLIASIKYLGFYVYLLSISSVYYILNCPYLWRLPPLGIRSKIGTLKVTPHPFF